MAVAAALALFCSLALTSPALAQTGAACGTSTLAPNDDFITDAIPLGFSIEFGDTFDAVYISNNGYLTFGDPAGSWTPLQLLSLGTPIIAPFWNDIDTRPQVSAAVSYGQTTYDSRPAFCVQWPGVPGIVNEGDELNDFGVTLVDRSDVAPGSFDIVFEYRQIEWDETFNSASRAGFAASGFRAFEFPGSGRSGAFVDTNATTGLVNSNRNSDVLGVHVFEIRGPVADAPTYPSTPDDGAANYPAVPTADEATEAPTTDDGAVYIGTCPAGYTSSGSGSAKVCTRTVSATESTGAIANPGATTFSCPAGFASSGSGATKTCTRTVSLVDTLPAPAPVVVVIDQTAPQASVVVPAVVAASAAASTGGFATSAPVVASPAAQPLAHTGATTDPLVLIALACIASGAIVMGNRRRAISSAYRRGFSG